jgi:hypothetical protein
MPVLLWCVHVYRTSNLLAHPTVTQSLPDKMDLAGCIGPVQYIMAL